MATDLPYTSRIIQIRVPETMKWISKSLVLAENRYWCSMLHGMNIFQLRDTKGVNITLDLMMAAIFGIIV
ncbi:hypothetical protein ACFL5M_01185 [Candidatus Neomarinimicrobiota bacterium]